MVLKDKQTKLTFHNGILTIGGTIIEVAYEDSHIFFDFGSEYNPKDPIQPKNLQELLDMGLVPFVNNVFDPQIPLTGYKNEEQTFKNQAVFLSHVHLDHSKIINYLDPQIPLYALQGTKSLLNTLNINNDFLFPLYKTETSNVRDIIGLENKACVEVGKIKVQALAVDHDAYGACGLLITTPDLVISYTGDLRIHGYKPEQTFEFCEASKNCDVLLIEGVSVSFNEIEDEVVEGTEPMLVEEIVKIQKDNPNKQLSFNFYISNIERILEIMNASIREVVLDAYSAYVVKEATGKEVKYYRLEDQVEYGLNPALELDFSVLLEDETRFFWQLGNLAVKYIGEMKKGGIYIHSNATPLGEFDPAYLPFIQAFEDNQISFERLACSGHAHPKDLVKIIDLIQPKLLVPIHSYRPEKLENAHGERYLPEKGKSI